MNSFKSLEELSQRTLSILERKELLRHPHFFSCPDGIDPLYHSTLIDKILMINSFSIEQELVQDEMQLKGTGQVNTHSKILYPNTQAWIGLDPQVLNTPYTELYDMIKTLDLSTTKIYVDLGAGYGRLALVLNSICPESFFHGFEIVEKRVIEAQRLFQELDINNAEMKLADLSSNDFILPTADAYFLYDFGTQQHICKILDDLSSKTSQPFSVVAKGRQCRSIIDHLYPWLSQINKPIHRVNYSIYFNL